MFLTEASLRFCKEASIKSAKYFEYNETMMADCTIKAVIKHNTCFCFSVKTEAIENTNT